MKTLIRNILLAGCFCIRASTVFSQPTTTDEKLAAQYLENKEYDKAITYYEKFFNKKDEAAFYNQYLICLIKLKEYDKAEKTVKRVIKHYPQELRFVVDLGTLYKDQGNTQKGNSEYERAIKLLTADQQQILSLANEFYQLQEWDYAIETYRKGKKLLNGFYPFSSEIAGIYFKKGDITSMVNEYLSLLELGDDQLQAVQNGLQPSFGEDKDEKKNEIIKTELLKKIQSDPDRIAYTELLIWFFIQEKNFNGAFIQAKALDKRKHEEGDRLLSLGQLCVSNEDYETATKCFQYVIDKGKDNYHYVNARMELLNAMYKKVTTKYSYTPADLQELEKNFIATINELGKGAGTALLMKNLAHLQAFFMNKTKEASDLLNETIKLPGINEQTKANCKLELGDVLLMMGQIWDASLLYSQVEFDFKHEPLGNEAKFRNAKLSYYNGEFGWAQAQLNVLKAATEKLIANDAMELSLTISENLKEPGDSVALSMFSRADLLIFRNQFDKALLTLDSVASKFPTTSLADDILYKKYQIKMKQGKYSDAGEQLQKLLDNYSFDILGDDALFKLAELNELYLNNSEKAKQLYEDLLTKFPGSIFTTEARKRFRKLRGDNVN
ncbi:MAG TPA: tetratricopeptide repeat protein [Bacteroidia bacterium]